MNPPRKVAIIGSTGTGKSTLAKKLSVEYGLPIIELDQILFEDGSRKSEGKFRQEVRDVTNEPHWICEGVFYNVADIIWPKADIVIWIDFPLKIAYIRTLRRTTARIIKREPMAGGKKETLRTAFGQQGLIRRLIHIHRKVNGKYEELLPLYVRPGKLIRLKSQKELVAFYDAISYNKN